MALRGAHMVGRLQDKIALITGGGTGIGKAIALGFAGEGANLALAQRRKELGEQTAQEAMALGSQAIALRGDISSVRDIEEVVSQTLNRFGRIDILVNNAAVFVAKPFLDLTEEEIDRTFAVNLRGTFILTQKVAKEMVKEKKGKMINISSGQAVLGMANFTHYTATKGAMNALTRALAVELGPHGICVNTIIPGFVAHDEAKKSIPPTLWGEVLEAARSRNPLGRVGAPEDCVGLAIYLASDESNFTNAQCIGVDGGDFSTKLRVIPKKE